MLVCRCYVLLQVQCASTWSPAVTSCSRVSHCCSCVRTCCAASTCSQQDAQVIFNKSIFEKSEVLTMTLLPGS